MYTDPIADMLTRFRNAQSVKKPEVILPYSKLKNNIARLLEKEGWFGKVEILEPEVLSSINKEKQTKFKQLKIQIKYNNNEPKITSLKRVSKPGQRVYVKKDEIPVVLNNFGIAVISTPKGLMTNKTAKKEGFGGEVICEIY
jgi:small subunit ribosomal protein S8